MRQRVARWTRSGFRSAKRPNSKTAAPRVNGNLRKSRSRKSRGSRSRSDRCERASNMPYSVQPTILDFKREKNSARAKHAANFSERVILQFFRTQVMQHENRDCRRKGLVRKRQCRCVALNHTRVSAPDTRAEPRRKSVIVLKTRHPRRSHPQLFRRRTRPRSQFEHMLPQLRALEYPGQKLPPRYPSPERRRAEPCFSLVHSSGPPNGSFRIRTRCGSRTIMRP